MKKLNVQPIMGLLFVLLVMLSTAALAEPSKPAPAEPFNNLQFWNVTPTIAGGRVTSVVGIPGNPKVYYIGAAGGGVWKSTDGGYHWDAIFSKEATSIISNVALDPSNPDIVWVATGEANPRQSVLNGAGLYRSPDGGKTWKLMGFKDAGSIAKVVVDPHNSDVVWVAVLGQIWGPSTERGVFKTSDGGKTWKKVLFVNDHTGAIDLTTDGSNSQVLFAATWQVMRHPSGLDDGGPGSGIWRSVDGGDTWTKLTEGIPDKQPIGRIGLAVAPSNPDRVYALIGSRDGVLFESRDLGENWHKVSDNKVLDTRPMYFSTLSVAPHDENKLYFSSFNLVQSDDGGKTARVIDKGVHVDHHAFWQDPENPARMIQGNDGGVYLSLDSGEHWRHADTLPIQQFYQVAASSGMPYMLCGGLQDNNGWCGPSALPYNTEGFQRSGPNHEWRAVVDGDGMYIVPAPSDPNIIYGDAQGANMARHDLKTGIQVGIKPFQSLVTKPTQDKKYRFNWTSPIAISPTDAKTVYVAGNVVFKSTDSGQHWSVISPDLTHNDKNRQISPQPAEGETQGTILSLVLATADPNVMWVGTDDGLVHVTRDGGAQWSNVTPSGAPKWERVNMIGVSPFDAGTAYAAFDGHQIGDRMPHVYMTDDYGKSWHSISDGLPDEPVVVVREDPNMKGFLVLGNMTGLWFSRDSGAHWQKFQSGFPTAPVFDIDFVHHDLVVATHGRGLFVLENLRPFEEMSSQIAEQSFHLFTPAEGIQYTSASWYRPRDVKIDYYLKDASEATPAELKQHQTPVKIVITDSSGQPVATEYGPSKTGVNEHAWSLRYDGPTQLSFGTKNPMEGEPVSKGPAVVPGTYHVAVTTNGKTQETTVAVLGDPNVDVPMSVLQANLKFFLQVRNNESAFNEMLNRITAMHASLEKTEQASGTSPELIAEAQSLDKKLTALKDSVYSKSSYESPRLNRAVTSFSSFFGPYGAFGRNGTIPPTPELLATANTVWGEVKSTLEKFSALVASDVAKYNAAALAAGAPTLRTDSISVKPL